MKITGTFMVKGRGLVATVGRECRVQAGAEIALVCAVTGVERGTASEDCGLVLRLERAEPGLLLDAAALLQHLEAEGLQMRRDVGPISRHARALSAAIRGETA